MKFPEILVLGATGRIGRMLQQCWPATGRDRRVLWQSRQPQEPGSALNWAVFDPLGSPDALRAAARGRAAILCLAGVVPGRGGDLHKNATLAEAAIRAGAETGARVLLASSAAVYGGRAGLLAEDLPLRPAAGYGRAKAGMERRGAVLAAKLGVELCALRIGNIAGLDAVLGGWRPGFELDAFGDGRSPRRSYIGGRDLARVLAAVLTAPRLPAALNVAAPGAVEMAALLDAAGLHWTPRPAPGGAIAEVRLDVTALMRIAPLPAEAADPRRMVAQWRALEPQIRKAQGLA